MNQEKINFKTLSEEKEIVMTDLTNFCVCPTFKIWINLETIIAIVNHLNPNESVANRFKSNIKTKPCPDLVLLINMAGIISKLYME